MSVTQCRPVFETLDNRRCFTASWPASGRARANVLVVQPFGDEASLCRRMIRLFAERLAAENIETCLFDYSGTGDSGGEFSDARWENWHAELAAMRRRVDDPDVPTVLLGIRLGACLALEYLERQSDPSSLLAWAPVFDGKSYLRQLKRLSRHASGAELAIDVGEQWANGESASIAGLTIHPALAAAMQDATPLAGQVTPRNIAYMDVRPIASDTDTPEMSVVARQQAARFEAAGCHVEATVVGGSGFWNVPDPVDCPELIDQSVRVVNQWLS